MKRVLIVLIVLVSLTGYTHERSPSFSVNQAYDKGSGSMNEDALLIKDNLFVVFDGATILDKYVNKDGKTGGWLAAKIAKETFSSQKAPLEKLALMTNNHIRQEMERAGINA